MDRKRFYLIIISGLSGILFCFLLLGFETFFCGLSFGTYHYNLGFFNVKPAFSTWIFMNLLQTGTWAAFLIPVIFYLKLLYEEIKDRNDKCLDIKLILSLSIIVIGTYIFMCSKYLFYPSSMPDHLFPMANKKLKMIILTNVGIIVAHFSLAGILLVNKAISNLDPSNVSNGQVNKYMEYRNILQFFLISLSLEIGFATLSTASLQNLIKSYNPTIFPIDLVYNYGLFYTLLISAIYIPIYINCLYTGKMLVKQIYPFALGVDIKNWREKKEALEKELGLKADWKENFQTLFALAGPVIGSIIPGIASLLKG